VAQRQVNIRLDDDDYRVLEAAANVNRRTLPEEVRTILVERVAAANEDPHVQELLRIWAERDGAADGTVTPIRRAGKPSRGGDGERA
jgi:hypothetical protein